MGFTLQEAQWLVAFYRSLPGQTVPAPDQVRPSSHPLGGAQPVVYDSMHAEAAAAEQATYYQDHPGDDRTGGYFYE